MLTTTAVITYLPSYLPTAPAVGRVLLLPLPLPFHSVAVNENVWAEDAIGPNCGRRQLNVLLRAIVPSGSVNYNDCVKGDPSRAL